VLCAGWLLCLGVLQAADFLDPVEKRDFDAAEKLFQDLNYERAEREFADFARTWVNSARRTEAILFQARSRHARTNFTGAIELLTTALPQAGKLADQYQFWLGEARFEAGQFDKAAETYALLLRDFTNSPHRFPAAHNEALARYKLGNQREKVVSLLRDPNGAFQRAAKASPTNDLMVSGTLLLGEALLAGKDYPAAEQAARVLEARRLEPEVDWQRRFLLGRVLAEAGRSAEALPVATNLVKLASALRQPLMEAESFALQGTVLERLGELAGAVAAFTNNLSTNTPLPLRHRALTNVVALNARQHKDAETVSLLENYSTQFPRDARLDLAQLTLGELRVKEFHGLSGGTNAPMQTNLLATALTNLNFVLLHFTNSPLRGRAHYQRGWCFWHLNQPAPAAADFSAATVLLPKSEDQAMARFKLAEAQALQNDHSNALRNFQLVVEQYGDLERIRNAYFDEALYRAMRSAWAVTNQAAAEAAFRKIIELFPENLVSDKATLLHAGELGRRGKPADARREFQAQLARFPQSALAPQVHLAIARTYRQDADWISAARQYEDWLRRYPTNTARADVEFERGYFSFLTGATNALALFTQFVTNYPAHPSTPQAQFWVGSIHDNLEQFDKAETAYQLLYQSTNANAAEWKPRALLAAGRSAYSRQSYKDATNYFSQLIGRESQAPAAVRAEAFFALGDTYLAAAQSGVPLAEDPYGDAINAYARITNNFSTNPIAARAMGMIGNCQLQRAAKDPKQFDLAADSFTKAMTWPGADAEARSLAEVALGVVREKQGRTKDAFEHWSNVLYEKNLKPAELADREATLRTLEGAMVEAGGHMARLREAELDWRGAIQIYQRLQEMAPAKRATLQLRIDRARQMLNGTKQ
jgi:TolA-binding protein